MKKIYTILVAVLITTSVFAQTPEAMSYQAVIRNASNQLVTNQGIGMQISILQGGATGTAVYVETHNTTTNANGLVTVELGNGTVVSGDFATIDWSADTYFIKTETDPTTEGGTSYTITGTSQLLSVAYALQAKEVENVDYSQITNTPNLFDGAWSSLTGTAPNVSIFNNDAGYLTSYTETDPIFTAWDKDYADLTNKPANATTTTDGFMSSADKTKLDGLTNADGSETKVIAGTNVTVTGTGTTASPYVVNATGATTLTIGQAYQGGIIFWLDATGQHGLIAATADQSTGIQWYNGTYRYTGTTGDGLYSGAMNTAMIIATQMADNQTGNFAAKVCADYSVTVSGVTYGDWYLPSKYELNLLYAQRVAVGGFASAYYWSSTETSNNYAWGQGFDDGYQLANYKNATDRVRGVRAF